jgi:hypothetical protein
MALSVLRLYRTGRKDKRGMMMNRKGLGRQQLQPNHILSQHIFGETKENHKNLVRIAGGLAKI